MILYKKRRTYKYNLHNDVTFKANIQVLKVKNTGLVTIDKNGKLAIKKKYAWDGPSGPTIDTKNFMRGSLIHDALYQLMREEFIAQHQRKRADEILWEVCREDGMSWLRATWVYEAVRLGGASAARPNMLSAPS